MADDEELRQARLEIARLRAYSARVVRENDDLTLRLTSSRAQVRRLTVQLRHLRSSTSWRITLPLRLFRRRVRDAARGSQR